MEQVVEDVLALNGIARHLKAGRASNGALRLDNTKLYFKTDDNGNPVSAAPYGECSDTITLHHACLSTSCFNYCPDKAIRSAAAITRDAVVAEELAAGAGHRLPQLHVCL